MTLAYWCILAAALLPYFTVGIAKWDRGFDNARPREWLERRRGAAQRAYWAHQNMFEAFPAFAAAVIVAHLAGAAQPTVDALALVFIAARVAYVGAYIADRPTLRSIVWGIGLLCVIGLFVAAALAR